MSRLIGLVGFAKSGKSTVADELVHLGFLRVKFAGPLKAMLKAIGLTNEHIEGALKEEPCDLLCGKTPRFAMITLGTEWGRDMIGPDLWLNLFKHNVRDAKALGYPVVCDDVRFPNEVETIKRMGGAIWRVERPGIDIDTGHQSEQHVEDIEVDEFILNDGTLDDLFRKVQDTLRRAG